MFALRLAGIASAYRWRTEKKKTFIAGIGALFLATGAAHAVSIFEEMEKLFKLQNFYWATQAVEKEVQEAEKEVRSECMFICAPDEQKN